VSGTAEFLEVITKWKKQVGDVLARVDPQLLVRIIELSSTRVGISQRELQQALKINQPRLNKLIKKLAACKWIKVCERQSSDRRVVLMVATDHGKARVEWLRKELSAMVVLPTPPVPTRTAPKKVKALRPPADVKALRQPADPKWLS
jgi:DNA-binding MarR family transcriptional regulator